MKESIELALDMLLRQKELAFDILEKNEEHRFDRSNMMEEHLNEYNKEIWFIENMLK